MYFYINELPSASINEIYESNQTQTEENRTFDWHIGPRRFWRTDFEALRRSEGKFGTTSGETLAEIHSLRCAALGCIWRKHHALQTVILPHFASICWTMNRNANSRSFTPIRRLSFSFPKTARIYKIQQYQHAFIISTFRQNVVIHSKHWRLLMGKLVCKHMDCIYASKWLFWCIPRHLSICSFLALLTVAFLA